MIDGRQIAVHFAEALDHEDYATIRSLLAVDATYVCRDMVHHGPKAIVDSYRQHGNAARRFDCVAYDSHIVAERDVTFRICFSDHITHADQHFTFRCEQKVQLGQSGKIRPRELLKGKAS